MIEGAAARQERKRRGRFGPRFLVAVRPIAKQDRMASHGIAKPSRPRAAQSMRVRGQEVNSMAININEVYTVEEVARELKMSERTAKKHFSQISCSIGNSCLISGRLVQSLVESCGRFDDESEDED